jgi:inosine triphosphate pyrophosphatase
MVKEKIYFITGNINKFNEIKQLIPEIERADFDLPEIQELDTQKIINYKIQEAKKRQDGLIFCEDVSLSIKDLNNLPGPLVKWFLKSIGVKGIWEIMKDRPKSAIAKSTIGLWDGRQLMFFEGETKGEIVEPVSNKGYGWDSLFKAEGKAFADMGSEIRPMRKEALIKLKVYLDNKK